VIQRVSELEHEPIVGKFYLVPCVKYAHGRWIPIIGPEHDDADYINVPQRHFHQDLRFLSDHEITTYLERYARIAVSCSPEQLSMTKILFASRLQHRTPVERKVKCRRSMSDFPMIISLLPAPWFEELEKAYSKQKLSCLRCPHRGMPLNGIPVKDSKVTCPGHGLQFNINTGELVSRL